MFFFFFSAQEIMPRLLCVPWSVPQLQCWTAGWLSLADRWLMMKEWRWMWRLWYLDWLTDRLVGWLTDWLAGCLTVWPTTAKVRRNTRIYGSSSERHGSVGRAQSHFIHIHIMCASLWLLYAQPYRYIEICRGLSVTRIDYSIKQMSCPWYNLRYGWIFSWGSSPPCYVIGMEAPPSFFYLSRWTNGVEVLPTRHFGVYKFVTSAEYIYFFSSVIEAHKKHDLWLRKDN